MAHSTFFAKTAIALLFASLIVGQSIRFVVAGQGGGILVSDIAVVLFLLVAALSFPSSPLIVSPFLLWSISTLLLHSSQLQQSEIVIALLYWVRLASIVLLYPFGMAILQKAEVKAYAKKAFVYTYAILLSFGFLQLIFFPSLFGFGNGWDPHIQRMVGTWFDPNFFGAFLALSLPAVVLWARSQAMRIGFFMMGSIAILLTKSRSTFIAATVALCVCCVVWLFSSSFPKQWKKMVLPGLITLGIVVAFAGIVLQERARQIFFHDPTIAIRMEAYKDVWRRLVEPHIFLGVGYNAYQVAAKDAGLISNYQIHSRGGSDSSILTLLVTTGIIGTALFLIPILLGFIRHYSFLYIWATVFLLVHSQFTNSLLYPHVLIPYILLVLLAL
ncbi:MAG: O-antigen ligase family protein [bacterium]|nr:O-antigen ligase family protein [bacterium]